MNIVISCFELGIAGFSAFKCCMKWDWIGDRVSEIKRRHGGSWLKITLVR